MHLRSEVDAWLLACRLGGGDVVRLRQGEALLHQVRYLAAADVGDGFVKGAQGVVIEIAAAQGVEEEVLVEPLVGDGLQNFLIAGVLGHGTGVGGDSADAHHQAGNAGGGRLFLQGCHLLGGQASAQEDGPVVGDALAGGDDQHARWLIELEVEGREDEAHFGE